MNKKHTKKNMGFTRTPTLALLQSFFSETLVKNKIIETFKFFSNINKQQKTMPKLVCGFTLIESLVAISILLVSIVGPVSLAQQSMQSARLVKNQIAAFYLAQDAVEFIRGKRDSNILSGAGDWLFGLGGCTAGNCLVDVPTGTISSCGTSCENIRRDATTGFYGYDNDWEETNFRRNVSVETVGPEEVYVVVEILWDNDEKSFLVREILFKLN